MSKLTKLENSQYEVIYAVDPIVWRDAQNKAFGKLSKDLEVKGFRKGNVPEAIARQHIDQGRVFNEAIGTVINDAFLKALEEHNLTPFAQPSYDITKLSDTELEFKFIITVQPEVELGQYKNLDIGHKEVEVSEEQIDLKIVELREQNAELVAKEGAAELGDSVVIDFKGFVGDEAFEGGEATNYSLELGSGSFIPGFEEQLVGKNAGDEFDINVTFPEQYAESLAGKDARFEIKLHEIKQKVTPKLSDDFIQQLNYPNVATELDLRNKLRDDLTKEGENNERSRYIDEVLKHLRESSKIELAPSIIDGEVNHQLHHFEQQLAQQGMTLEQYLEFSNTDEEEYTSKLREDAEINMKNFLILEQIAEEENIEITDEIVDFELAKIAMQYNMEEAQVREIFANEQQGGLERLRREIRRTHTFDLLVNENN